MSKEIRFGVEGRAAMLRGVDMLADAVQVRMISEMLDRSTGMSTGRVGYRCTSQRRRWSR